MYKYSIYLYMLIYNEWSYNECIYNGISIGSRPKMVAFNHYVRRIYCPKK